MGVTCITGLRKKGNILFTDCATTATLVNEEYIPALRETVQRVCDLYRTGKTIKVISEELKLPFFTVKRHLKRAKTKQYDVWTKNKLRRK